MIHLVSKLLRYEHSCFAIVFGNFIFLFYFIFLDIDECLINNGSCHQNANCTNIAGSHNCTCRNGYVGDGNNCTGMQ